MKTVSFRWENNRLRKFKLMEKKKIYIYNNFAIQGLFRSEYKLLFSSVNNLFTLITFILKLIHDVKLIIIIKINA